MRRWFLVFYSWYGLAMAAIYLRTRGLHILFQNLCSHGVSFSPGLFCNLLQIMLYTVCSNGGGAGGGWVNGKGRLDSGLTLIDVSKYEIDLISY